MIEGGGGAPPSNPAVRAELEAMPLADLVRELSEKDPASAQTIDLKNPRRVIRALEVFRLTGHSFESFKSPWSIQQSPGNPRFFGLERTAEDLKERIDRRVQWMFNQGLVDETRSLLQHGLGGNRTAMQAIGYRQVVEHLEGQRSLPETIALVQQKTRQYAKRQMTWFRRQLPVRWIRWERDASASSVAKTIFDAVRTS